MEEKGLVYGYKNILNDRWYIGQTLERREKQRMYEHLKYKRSGCKVFKKALEKYGAENFEYHVLETNIKMSELPHRESWWIKNKNSFKNGYNSKILDSCKVKYTDEIKKKISENVKLSFSNGGLDKLRNSKRKPLEEMHLSYMRRCDFNKICKVNNYNACDFTEVESSFKYGIRKSKSYRYFHKSVNLSDFKGVI